MRTFAIGDVHGRADLLEALLAKIAISDSPNARIVFLGDIIDRGPESRRAMDLVAETLNSSKNSRLILGNHEEFLLRFINQIGDAEKLLWAWMRGGGLPTLESYGISHGTSIQQAREKFLREHPLHVEIIRSAVSFIETKQFHLVHAGVDPSVPLPHQDARKTRWIREEFLDYPESLSKIIVHGHTPTPSGLPEVLSNRIALDTAAYRSNRLCCAILDDLHPVTFLIAEGHAHSIHVQNSTHRG